MKAWPAVVVSGVRPTDDNTELIHAALVDYDVSAIEEIAPDAWRVFFGAPEARDSAAAALRTDFPHLTVEPLDVADEDWAARSQASLRAVTVGRIVVAPPWDPDAKAQGSGHKSQGPIIVVIQPSMGFGTGHHATTRLCLAALQRIDVRGCRVIDVGTGSGVLAIAASLLGAADVVGIDDDLDAVQAAAENVRLNPGSYVTLAPLDVRATSHPPADVVLANLTGGLLANAAPRLQALVNQDGRLILSGFMVHEEGDVLDRFPSYTVERRTRDDEWLCVTLCRPTAPSLP
jgi:ribosomal protein L11 methyltransferase